MSRRAERAAYYARTTPQQREDARRLAEVNWALRQRREGEPESPRLVAEREQLRARLRAAEQAPRGGEWHGT